MLISLTLKYAFDAPPNTDNRLASLMSLFYHANENPSNHTILKQLGLFIRDCFKQRELAWASGPLFTTGNNAWYLVPGSSLCGVRYVRYPSAPHAVCLCGCELTPHLCSSWPGWQSSPLLAPGLLWTTNLASSGVCGVCGVCGCCVSRLQRLCLCVWLFVFFLIILSVFKFKLFIFSHLLHMILMILILFICI